MMNCEQFTRSVSDFLERSLRFSDRMAVLLHVAMCKGCRAYIEQMRLSILALGALRKPVEAGPGFDSLLQRYRQEIRGSTPGNE